MRPLIMTQKIGFIGQGWVGRNYADDFENRGFKVVRYSLEPAFIKNKDKISKCDIVFIAVPTPTTPKGFDDSIVRDALKIVGKGKTAVLKSTIVPGTTKEIQKLFPKITLLYSPEFLSEATAKQDTLHPFCSIVGMSKDTSSQKSKAKQVLAILPKAPFSLICTSTEAEIIKYTHNIGGFVQIIFFNIMFDLAKKLGCDWSVIHSAIVADPYIPNRYSEPIHKSGRGAGGHCFIKDFQALKNIYQKTLPEDKTSLAILEANIQKNIELLMSSRKDINLLKGVYGERRSRI